MAELMEHDAREDQSNKGYRIQRRIRTALSKNDDPDDEKKEQESDMDPNGGSSYSTNQKGPAHPIPSYFRF